MSLKPLLTKAEQGFPALDYQEGLKLFSGLMDNYLDRKRVSESTEEDGQITLRFYIEALKQVKEIQTLLMVDETHSYSKTAELFNEYGYYVRVESTEAALNLIRRMNFDLVMVTDSTCIDPVTVAEITRQMNPEAQIILLTKSSSSGDVTYTHFKDDTRVDRHHRILAAIN